MKANEAMVAWKGLVDQSCFLLSELKVGSWVDGRLMLFLFAVGAPVSAGKKNRSSLFIAP